MMFGDSKTQFIEQTRAARIERANDRKREQSIILVQSLVRGWLVRKRIRNLILSVLILAHLYMAINYYLVYDFYMFIGNNLMRLLRISMI